MGMAGGGQAETDPLVAEGEEVGDPPRHLHHRGEAEEGERYAKAVAAAEDRRGAPKEGDPPKMAGQD